MFVQKFNVGACSSQQCLQKAKSLCESSEYAYEMDRSARFWVRARRLILKTEGFLCSVGMDNISKTHGALCALGDVEAVFEQGAHVICADLYESIPVDLLLSASNISSLAFNYLCPTTFVTNTYSSTLPCLRASAALGHASGSNSTMNMDELVASMIMLGVEAEIAGLIAVEVFDFALNCVVRADTSATVNELLDKDSVLDYKMLMAALTRLCIFHPESMTLVVQECRAGIYVTLKWLAEQYMKECCSFAGPMYASMKMVEMLAVMRAAVVSKYQATQGARRAIDFLSKNVLVAFTNECDGCNSNCGKFIVSAVSSGDEVCNMVNDVLTRKKSSSKAVKEALDDLLDTGCFLSVFLMPIANEYLECAHEVISVLGRPTRLCRLSSLALRALRTDSYHGVDISSYIQRACGNYNGYGLYGLFDSETPAVDVREAVCVANVCSSINHVSEVKYCVEEKAQLSKWIECVISDKSPRHVPISRLFSFMRYVCGLEHSKDSRIKLLMAVDCLEEMNSGSLSVSTQAASGIGSWLLGRYWSLVSSSEENRKRLVMSAKCMAGIVTIVMRLDRRKSEAVARFFCNVLNAGYSDVRASSSESCSLWELKEEYPQFFDGDDHVFPNETVE